MTWALHRDPGRRRARDHPAPRARQLSRLFAPPLGLGLYGACLIGKVPIEVTVKPVLIGDPGRAYLSKDRLVTRDLEEFHIKRLAVWSLAS